MTCQKAFSIAELLASHSIPCKLYKDANGWHVVAQKNSEKYKLMFGEE